MKYTAILAALAALLIANQSAKAQGALTPPGAPAESQKSLQEIYDAIQSAKAEFAALVQQAVPSVPGMVTVLGGTLPESSQLAGESLSTFYIGKYEVTWGEWQEVRSWAVANGYTDLANVGDGNGINHPVTGVGWFDVVKWCNAKSEKEGLEPVYQVGGSVFKTGESEPVVNNFASGYRLPLETEWEWAARGGVYSGGYIHSGSNDLNSVGWYDANSDGTTHEVGIKMGNELGIFDMSGNVWEWCADLIESNYRRLRGSSWGSSGEIDLNYRDGNDPWSRPQDRYAGFRLARSY